MVRYAIKRVVWLIVMLLIMLTVMYFIMSMVQMHNFGPRPRVSFFDNFNYALRNFKIYVSNIVTDWNWGYDRNEPVWDIFKDRVTVTLRINGIVLISFLTIGTFLGVVSALARHTIIDVVISTVTMIFNAIPPFFLIVPLIILFSYQFELLPNQFPPPTQDVDVRIRGYIIPILALAGPAISNVARLIRGELIEAMDAEYMVLARVKGLSRRKALVKHGLKNAIVPIIPEIPTLFMAVLMSSFFIESVYNIHGLARWYLSSMYRRMMGGGYFFIIIPNAMIVSMFYAGLVTSLSIVTDISLGFLDPRIRVGKK